MRFHRVSVAASVLCLCAFGAEADMSRENVSSPTASVVKVIGYSSNGRQFFGSGVVVGGNTVATNCHVTRSAERIRVHVGNEILTASAQRLMAQRELCVLSVPGLGAPAVKIGATRSLRAGDKVIAIGYPNGGGMNGSRGEVLDLFRFDNGFAVQSTARFTHGSSGGGLFDSSGALVGLLTFFRTVDGREPAYFAIPIEWLDSVLAEPRETISPFEAAPFWSQELDRQPVFLRAAALEAAEMWSDLFEVAKAWAAEEPSDHNAWRALARAATQTGDLDTAIEAHRQSVMLGASLP